jgi:hypothetical protein
MILERFDLLSTTCIFRKQLSLELARKLSKSLRARESIDALRVTHIGDVAPDEHIEFESEDRIRILIHPRFEFRVVLEGVAIKDIPPLEERALTLLNELARVKSNMEVVIRTMGHVLIKDNKQKARLARFVSEHRKKEVPSMAVDGIVLRVNKSVRLAFAIPDDVDILLSTPYSASEVSKGFIIEHLNQGLQSLENLF